MSINVYEEEMPYNEAVEQALLNDDAELELLSEFYINAAQLADDSWMMEWKMPQLQGWRPLLEELHQAIEGRVQTS